MILNYMKANRGKITHRQIEVKPNGIIHMRAKIRHTKKSFRHKVERFLLDVGSGSFVKRS